MLRCFGSRASGWRGSTFNMKTALVPNIERLKFVNKSIIQEVQDQQMVTEVETKQKNLIKDVLEEYSSEWHSLLPQPYALVSSPEMKGKVRTCDHRAARGRAFRVTMVRNPSAAS